MFQRFDEESKKVLKKAKLEMQELKHPYVSSEHLLLSILKNKNEVSEKLKEYNFTKKELESIKKIKDYMMLNGFHYMKLTSQKNMLKIILTP